MDEAVKHRLEGQKYQQMAQKPQVCVIGLSGKIGCGKTTVAQMLVDSLPGAVRMSFGDPVKREAAAIYGFPVELAYLEDGKSLEFVLSIAGKTLMGKDTATVREVLQYHGTQLRRAQDPWYWIDAMRQQIDATDALYVIVDDVRFPGEADLIKAYSGGALYRLDAYPGWKPGPYAGHESETALDDYPNFTERYQPDKGELIGAYKAIVAQFIPPQIEPATRGAGTLIIGAAEMIQAYDNARAHRHGGPPQTERAQVEDFRVGLADQLMATGISRNTSYAEAYAHLHGEPRS